MPSALPTNLIELLACPITRSPLRQEDDFLVSAVGGLKYPIQDGIPKLVPEAAIFPLDAPSLSEFKAKYGPKA